MNIDATTSHLSSPTLLRLRAEEQLAATPPDAGPAQSQKAPAEIVHDLEIRRIELELQNAELRDARYEVQTTLGKYTDLYENAPVGYITMDRQGAISAVNLAGAALLRVERSILITLCFKQFLAEESCPVFNAFMEKVFSTTTKESCEVVLHDNAGTLLTVQIESAAAVSAGECHCALIDITGRNQVGQGDDNSAGSEILRVEQGAVELEFGVCSLRDALDASMAMLREKTLHGCLDFRLDLAPEVDERIVADGRKLQQILYSLLANAVRFTPAGGTVDVRAVRDGHFIKITVTDSGIGIGGEDLPNVFETFTPEEAVYTTGNEGSGLGLGLTRQLVELHGGELTVESEVGTGSRFSFTIPLRNCAGIT
jgi:nitrogen fixation/metabolism regulation signal transduction histidine kinase